MSKQKYGEKDMERFLAERYSHPYEWVFLTQVRSSTGSASRIADAMAFNMYQSTGFEILGFEIKVSRSDWLHELKNMGKSNEIMEYCDKWFLVVPDADIVQEGELPKGWGLLVLKDDKLVIKSRPTLQKTNPIPDYFLASILRRNATVMEQYKNSHIAKTDIEEEVRKAEQRGYERGQGYNGKQYEQRFKDMQEKFDTFEEVTGVKLESWRGLENAKTVGRFVNVALQMDEYSLRSCTESMGRAVKTLEKGIVEINKCKKEFKKK